MSKMYYKNEPVENYSYDDQPHEIAAREQGNFIREYTNLKKLPSIRNLDISNAKGFGYDICLRDN